MRSFQFMNIDHRIIHRFINSYWFCVTKKRNKERKKKEETLLQILFNPWDLLEHPTLHVQINLHRANPSPRLRGGVILWEVYDRLSRLHPPSESSNPRITIPKNTIIRKTDKGGLGIETATGVIVHRVIRLIVNNYGWINSILGGVGIRRVYLHLIVHII